MWQSFSTGHLTIADFTGKYTLTALPSQEERPSFMLIIWRNFPYLWLTDVLVIYIYILRPHCRKTVDSPSFMACILIFTVPWTGLWAQLESFETSLLGVISPLIHAGADVDLDDSSLNTN